MATKQDIEIIISDEGMVKFHISGIKGAKCADLARAIAGSSGGELSELNYTSEYYEKEHTKNNVKGKII